MEAFNVTELPPSPSERTGLIKNRLIPKVILLKTSYPSIWCFTRCSTHFGRKRVSKKRDRRRNLPPKGEAVRESGHPGILNDFQPGTQPGAGLPVEISTFSGMPSDVLTALNHWANTPQCSSIITQAPAADNGGFMIAQRKACLNRFAGAYAGLKKKYGNALPYHLGSDSDPKRVLSG